MTNNAYIEVTRLQTEFAAAQADGGRLQLELLALFRDENELNERLTAAYQKHENVSPLLLESRDLLLHRAQLLTDCATKDAQCATLCRQSADAIERLAKSAHP
jgi:hypothetical protein